MTWARVSSFGIAIAVALIIIANAPAVLTDTLQTAIAQIRVNAATTQPLNVVVTPSETTGEAPTLVKKAK
jgi:hypothetical protein